MSRLRWFCCLVTAILIWTRNFTKKFITEKQMWRVVACLLLLLDFLKKLYPGISVLRLSRRPQRQYWLWLKGVSRFESRGDNARGRMLCIELVWAEGQKNWYRNRCVIKDVACSLPSPMTGELGCPFEYKRWGVPKEKVEWLNETLLEFSSNMTWFIGSIIWRVALFGFSSVSHGMIFQAHLKQVIRVERGVVPRVGFCLYLARIALFIVMDWFSGGKTGD